MNWKDLKDKLLNWEDLNQNVRYSFDILKPDTTDIVYRHAAVMILFYPEKNIPFLPLTIRPVYEGAHSGQISLPGGAIEESTDSELFETALRETEEEIGVKPELLTIVGSMRRIFIPPSRFIVTPFIAVCESTPEFKPDPHEVEKIIPVPLEFFLDENSRKEEVFSASKYFSGKRKAPWYLYNEHRIWGATAFILTELADLLH